MTCEFQLLISVVVTVCLREEMEFSLSLSQGGLLKAKVYLVFFLDRVYILRDVIINSLPNSVSNLNSYPARCIS
jgi:hypothetical protein